MKKKYKNQNLNNKAPVPTIPVVDHRTFNKNFVILSHLLIIVLGFIAYSNSLNGKFLYDDECLIEKNVFIKSPSGIINCFTKGEFEGGGRITNFYRPLQIFSYSLNYDFCKLDERGYHFVNILLHILAALSVFWLIDALFSNNILSFITAVLFVVHPIHTEAVSYISGRCEPLALFFMAVCMTIYIKLIDQARFNIPGYFFLGLCYIGALLSKEISIILPVLLLLYHFVFGKKIKAAFFSLLGMSIIYAVIRFCHLNPMPPSFNTDTVFDRIPGFFVAILTYIKLIFIPFPLHMEYGQKIFAWLNPMVIGGVILTAALAALGYVKRSNNVILFSLGWFFLALLPVSNLYKINFFMAEHFLYVPSVGIFLLIAYGLSLLYAHKRYKIMVLVLTSSAVIFFLTLTIRQNHYWKDPLTFYQMTVKNAPDSANAYNNLGKIYEDQGDLTQALSDYNKAIQSNPNTAEAYLNRGKVYNSKGDYDGAVADFNKAIGLNPRYSEAYNNRASVYANQGNLNQAILDYDKAIELNPSYVEAYANQGSVYSKQGNNTDAMQDFNKAIELNPNYAPAYSARGSVDISQNNPAQAILDYNKAIELDPNLAEAYLNRGLAFNDQGNFDQAIADINKAIELEPNNADAYNNHGSIYANKGNLTQALSDFNKAIALNPKYAQAFANRSRLLYFQKEYDKSWADARKVQELGAQMDPKLFEALKAVIAAEK